ncbi:hypothetical protein QYF61_019795 [Mycteria americana]|uniref:Reverse transcriptase domain-containing protein n=1 Tax=Mycteria americana TaxID=33587 RepID=A0AAN7MRR1_MYCAM|nr:hypothetical protein QYF61_019795 [Mycteria americana]
MLELQYELESKAAKCYASNDIANAFFSVPFAAEYRGRSTAHGLIQTALEQGEAPEHVQYIDDIIVWGNTGKEVIVKRKRKIQILLKDGFAIKQSKVKGLKRQLQREWRLSLHKEQPRGNGYKLHQERFHLDTRKFVYSKNNHSLEKPPQGCGRVLIIGGFQDVIGPEEIQFWGIKLQDGHHCIPMDVINKITAMFPPANKKETQGLLGVVGFWRLHILEVVDTEAQLLLAPQLPVLQWMFKGRVPTTHATKAMWSKWVVLIMQWARMGNSNCPGILEEIMDWCSFIAEHDVICQNQYNWQEGRDFGALPREVTHAKEAPLYNKLPEKEKQYALFTDGSCHIVGNHQSWKAAV